jgi:ABC-type amino acid transport system permease subunit
MHRQILVKLPNIKFCENPFSGSLVVTCGYSDRQTGMAKLLGTFLQLLVEIAPKIGGSIVINAGVKCSSLVMLLRMTDKSSRSMTLPQVQFFPNRWVLVCYIVYLLLNAPRLRISIQYTSDLRRIHNS